MKFVGKILFIPLFLLNILTVLLLIVSAWSGCLFVKSFPAISIAQMAFPILFIANVLFLILWLLFRQRSLWLPLSGILLTLPALLTYSPLNIKSSDVSSNDSIVRLMSYNVYLFGTCSADASGKSNPILSHINSSGCDIVCLQETEEKLLSNNSANYKDFLPNLPYECNNADLLIKSRWPIIDWRKINFDDTRNKAVYCHILIGQDTVALYNCHFQSFCFKQDEIDQYNNLIRHPNEAANYISNKTTLRKLIKAAIMRSEQAELIADMLDRETAQHIILCGDFNDTPLSYAHHVISRRLKDVYRAAGFGPGISYHANRLYFRIDHIFCSDDIEPVRCRVDNSIKDSDHYPILSVLRIQK